MKDLWAYLRSLPPAARPNRPHELDFPFSLGVAALAWQVLYFDPQPFRRDPAKIVSDTK